MDLKMDKNVAYCETITSRSNILTLLLLNLAIVIAIYFKGLEFKTYLAIAGIFAANCTTILLCWRYAIQIDGTAISFGYYFTGKEKVLLNTVEYAEILIFDRKNSTSRFAIHKLGGPPVHWVSGVLIRLRLKKEYLTRYKLKRKKKVKQLLLRSRNPESVLSVLSEKGVPVQRIQRKKSD